MHFKDSLLNRYLVTYSYPNLNIQKLNALGALIWNSSIPLANAINFNPSFSNSILEQFISASQFLFTSSGKLIIAGQFQLDTIAAQLGTPSTNIIFIDNTTGNFINEYLSSFFYDPYNYHLQEDSLGNINIVGYTRYSYDFYLEKISQAGVLITHRIYGDANANLQKHFIVLTKNYIYLAFTDSVNYFNVFKSNKTQLDTVFYSTCGLNLFFDSDLFDATDSNLFIYSTTYGLFQNFDANGSLICTSLINGYFGTKVSLTDTSCFILGNGLEKMDTNCNFNYYSDTLDLNANYIAATINPYSYHSKDVVPFAHGSYFLGALNGSLGILGFVDSYNKDFSGNVFFDANNNCVLDTSDIGIPNQLIQVNPQGSFIFTNENGSFSNYLDAGNYSLNVQPFNTTSTFCPPSIALNIIDTTLTYSGNNFAVQDQLANLQDLSISINQFVAIPGYQTFVDLTARNVGPVVASGIIKLTMDSSLFTFNYSSVPPDSTSGSNFFWYTTNLGFLNQFGVFAYFLTNSNATPGNSFTTSAEIININGETNLSNNIDIYTGKIIGSYDPNVKTVYPKGLGANGVISPVDTLLKYKIQFQNTGSYQAFKIVVTDTIDPSLDISTFKLLSTSHKCKMSFAAANVLQFTFEDINLPDSTTDEMLSHGFINYSIETKRGLPLLTQIKKKANIYFDFNDPVITNETLNTIDVLSMKENPSEIFLKIFPNLVSDKINLVTNSKFKKFNVTIVDLQGRIIQSEVLQSENGVSSMTVQNLQTGFYLLKVESGAFSLTRSFVKK